MLSLHRAHSCTVWEWVICDKRIIHNTKNQEQRYVTRVGTEVIRKLAEWTLTFDRMETKNMSRPYDSY